MSPEATHLEYSFWTLQPCKVLVDSNTYLNPMFLRRQSHSSHHTWTHSCPMMSTIKSQSSQAPEQGPRLELCMVASSQLQDHLAHPTRWPGSGSLPLLMSSNWGSGEGLSFRGEVLGPAGGFVGARNGMGGGGGGGCDGCGGRAGCCSIRAWILLLPSALK
jgi:hypothetical protein